MSARGMSPTEAHGVAREWYADASHDELTAHNAVLDVREHPIRRVDVLNAREREFAEATAERRVAELLATHANFATAFESSAGLTVASSRAAVWRAGTSLEPFTDADRARIRRNRRKGGDGC